MVYWLLSLLRLHARFWSRKILKIQGDSTLEVGCSIIHSKIKSALAGSPVPKAQNFIQFRVEELPLGKGKVGGG